MDPLFKMMLSILLIVLYIEEYQFRSLLIESMIFHIFNRCTARVCYLICSICSLSHFFLSALKRYGASKIQWYRTLWRMHCVISGVQLIFFLFSIQIVFEVNIQFNLIDLSFHLGITKAKSNTNNSISLRDVQCLSSTNGNK